MSAAGHRLITPTYTGLGERDHLASPSNDLETHIQDVLAVIKYEDLNDVVLIGHSYGGMVATGVADRARDRITQLIYLDAFVPREGQSLFDFYSPEQRRIHEPGSVRRHSRDRSRQTTRRQRKVPTERRPDLLATRARRAMGRCTTGASR
jgi:pimeloyl-ACP methyl ester carboxylesterase